MTKFLDEIIANKRREITNLKVCPDLEGLPRTRDFLQALTKGKLSLIAEIKKASPSAGVIAEKFEPIYLAKVYEESGAAAISVLTEEKFFQGKLEHLKQAKESTTIPVLRKDFIIDEKQIYESRVAGADAILLIVRILTDEHLNSFLKIAQALHMQCLVEVHSEKEAERALKSGAQVIGINNRDLDTFKVDFKNTLRIIERLPELKKRTIVSESGISSAEQVKELKAAGVSAILVGESLLKSRDIGAKIREMMQ